jgi:cellulose synthase/poly-beta-1,6-N-acetylglucosamine synthase-like glycosyltransferase
VGSASRAEPATLVKTNYLIVMASLFYILALLTILYALSMLFFTAGLLRLSAPQATDTPFVSIVIAARNEEDNITPLFAALADQDYLFDKFEIILVDDASTDATAVRIKTAITAHQQLTIHPVTVRNRTEVMSPKKNALAQGIAQARGEIVLFTDADCRPGAPWISTMVRHFDKNVGLVIGFSPYERPAVHGIGARLIAIDSLSLAALSAGSSGWGRPATCSGRNLAYRKCVYEQVGGFRDISQFLSGDDDLFLKLVAQKTNWQIRYAYSAATIVPTLMLKSVRQFVQQRIRHASKGFHYGWRMTSILTCAWIFNALLLILLFTSLWPQVLVMWSIKALAELALLFAFAKKMKRLSHLAIWPLAVLLHVPYVVVFGALGPFTKYSWKDARPS